MARFNLFITDVDGLPPCAAITVGKLEFRRYTKVRNTNPDLPDLTHLGAVGDYSEKDIAEFEQAAKHLVVRWFWGEKNGKTYRRAAQVIDTRLAAQGAYQRDEADEPITNYLQVIPVGPSASPLPIGIGSASPEQLEAVAASQRADANRSEAIARQDPADARTRAQHGRAKARGEHVPGGLTE